VGRWGYRIAEHASALLTIVATVWCGWFLLSATERGTAVDTPVIVTHALVPIAILVLWYIFHRVNPDTNTSGSVSLVVSIATIIKGLDDAGVTGIHQVILALVLLILIIYTVIREDALLTLVKVLVGMFIGMQIEKRHRASNEGGGTDAQ
jgi:hypothetical protein